VTGLLLFEPGSLQLFPHFPLKTKVNCLTLNYGKRWTPGKGVGKIEFPGLASPAASIS